MDSLFDAILKNDKGIESRQSLNKVAEIFRRNSSFLKQNEKESLYDKTLKISFHYHHLHCDYFILGIYQEKKAVGYQLIEGNSNYLFKKEFNLEEIVILPYIELDFSALEEKKPEQLIQEQYSKENNKNSDIELCNVVFSQSINYN